MPSERNDTQYDEEFYFAPSCTVPDQDGRLIDQGRILLRESIGQGGWGVVHLGVTAKPTSTNPLLYYAVKCIRHVDMASHHILALSREVRLHELCSSKSTRVVKYIKVLEDEDEEIIFIISEFCRDGDLLDMILNDRYVGDHDLIRDVFLQILEAVEETHTLNVFHRDLKPENILCKAEGTKAVLADFGLSTRERSSDEYMIGSEAFMSPEVRGGLHYPYHRNPYSTRRADIWALGVILLNLICGCSPWAKASTSDPDFFNYLIRDRQGFLIKNFPITEEVNFVLQKIFTPEAANRISIAALKEEIKNIKEFTTLKKGASLEALVAAHNEAVMDIKPARENSAECKVEGREYVPGDGRGPRFTLPPNAYAFPPPPVHPDLHARRAHTHSSTSSQHAPEPEPELHMEVEPLEIANRHMAAFPNPDADSFVIISNDELDDLFRSSDDDESDSDSDSDTDSDSDSEEEEMSDSDEESVGPITPEQHAVDADVSVITDPEVLMLEDVSDIPGISGMGVPVTCDPAAATASPPIPWADKGKGKAVFGVDREVGFGAVDAAGPSSAEKMLRETAKRIANARPVAVMA